MVLSVKTGGRISGVAWVIGARGGVQFCRHHKSSDAWCPLNTPFLPPAPYCNLVRSSLFPWKELSTYFFGLRCKH